MWSTYANHVALQSNSFSSSKRMQFVGFSFKFAALSRINYANPTTLNLDAFSGSKHPQHMLGANVSQSFN